MGNEGVGHEDQHESPVGSDRHNDSNAAGGRCCRRLGGGAWLVGAVNAFSFRRRRRARGQAAVPYDINGDGFGDVVVADAFATVSGKEWAGVLRVAFGSSVGLTGTVQVLTQDSPGIKGGRAGSLFGQGVISADFDADGYADVAGQAYGDIQVVYGGPSGLTSRDQVFSMETAGAGVQSGWAGTGEW